MNTTLTNIQAYKAMFHMLEQLYNENPYHELGDVLSSMRLLEDDTPADQGFVGRWSEAVEKVANN